MPQSDKFGQVGREVWGESEQRATHIFPELDEVLLVGGVGWGEKVTYEEEDQDKLDGGAHWIILIARLDISDKDCRTRHLVKVG